MTFEDFTVLDFPRRGGMVYVLFWITDEVMQTPFYVGETDRFFGRMDDYDRPVFACPTDFRVGEAIKHLKNARNCRIIVKFKPSSDHRRERRKEENQIIQDLNGEERYLLNELPGYNYVKASEENVRLAIQRFCDEHVANRGYRKASPRG